MDFSSLIQKRRKPKLDRRNAIKNIDYEAPSSSSFTSSTSNDVGSLRTRSLDISPYAKTQTSFRIEGTEGEIDRICYSLGLSGPDDLSIPTSLWESTRKSRSSELYFPKNEVGVEKDCFLSRFGGGERVLDSGGSEKGVNLLPLNAGNGERGIRGIRPPVLAPPPLVSRPVLDNLGSSWDILKSFAPDNDSKGGSYSYRCLSDEENGDGEEEDEVVVRMDGMIIEEDGGVRFGETTLLSESCSFSTSNDDDSSSQNTDPMYIISPNARFKRDIKSWTKGSLLGSGSFGTVYEGLSDDGFFFAVKEVSLLDQGSQAKQSIVQLEQEISLLSQFEHENIVQYLGTDKDEEKLYIFLELVTKGSLAQLYQKYHLQDSQATKFNDVKSSKGTPFWMAPEMQALFRIGRGEPPPVPNSLSRVARDFILQCVQVSADDRPTAAQLLEHPFVKRVLFASSGPASPLHHNWRQS
ncbi:hypothetical protein IFM89_001850 [Coptis chinensis]|uniref:mitogen-activated protein kinase kinase kinase n=1 Tax=Coptis chinensis TaxID=261450 RepID=A0A835LQK2_9MAGN|nr:hypothetical protein IFM89_001850 [Coptis chinensis]